MSSGASVNPEGGSAQHAGDTGLRRCRENDTGGSARHAGDTCPEWTASARDHPGVSGRGDSRPPPPVFVCAPPGFSGGDASGPRLRIVVGVTGGIAAYKAVFLVRGFVLDGHDVHVVPTAAALRF